jgi:hypothetical protein
MGAATGGATTRGQVARKRRKKNRYVTSLYLVRDENEPEWTKNS